MKIESDSNGIIVYYDRQLMANIERRLGSLGSQKHAVLKNAVNKTARQVRKKLTSKMAEEYTAKKKGINDATRIAKRASNSDPDAVITVKGKPEELKKFKTSVSASGAKAQILQSENLKLIQSRKGSRAKAFLATFTNGHTAIVQRQDGKLYSSAGRAARAAKWGKGADMTAIKSLLSVSYPTMAKSKALSELMPEIHDILLDNVRKEVERVLNK